MAGNMEVLVVIMVAISSFLQSTTATVYTVGDATGWKIPSSNSEYSTWASAHKFAVGDVLVFDFTTGAHDVAQVTNSSYNACNETSPISIIHTGPANITLTTAGENYFICTFSGGHCLAGQKLAVNVTGTSSTSPPPPPSSTTGGTTTPPPPPPSSAPPSAGGVTFLVMFMFLVVNFFY